jgi:hypothetical protein
MYEGLTKHTGQPPVGWKSYFKWKCAHGMHVTCNTKNVIQRQCVCPALYTTAKDKQMVLNTRKMHHHVRKATMV